MGSSPIQLISATPQADPGVHGRCLAAAPDRLSALKPGAADMGSRQTDTVQPRYLMCEILVDAAGRRERHRRR